MNLVFQWSNTNLKTKPKPLVLFAFQNNAPTFLGRKSVLTSMIHRASRPQAEDSGFSPRTRGPREGDLLPTVPSEGCLQLLCRRELERPSVTSSGSRCSPEEREQRTQVLRSSQEISGLTLRGGTRHGGARRRGWGRNRRHTPTHSSDQRNTPTSQRGLAIPGHRKALAPGGRYGTERNCV